MLPILITGVHQKTAIYRRIGADTVFIQQIILSISAVRTYAGTNIGIHIPISLRDLRITADLRISQIGKSLIIMICNNIFAVVPEKICRAVVCVHNALRGSVTKIDIIQGNTDSDRWDVQSTKCPVR